MQAEELQKLFDYILGVGPICFRSWLDHDTSAVIRKSGKQMMLHSSSELTSCYTFPAQTTDPVPPESASLLVMDA